MKNPNGRGMKHNASLVALALAMASSSFVVEAEAARKPAKAAKSVEAELRLTPGDETGNEMKALKTEMLVMQSEKRALVQIQRLLKKHKGTPMEPEILFRMAELYMRRARTHRFFEVHKDSNQVMSFVPTLVKEASEAGEIRRAIAIYEDLQRKYPRFRQMDVVIFNTAYARQQLGEDKEAERNFNRIVTEFPRSPLVPDSYLAIGELNYNNRQFAKALENFTMVKRYPNSRVYPYGMYKAAWCHYNMQDAMSAMKQLEEVVRFGRQIAEKKLDSKLDLRKEALNDLAMFFGEVLPAERAVDYFVKQSEGLDPAPVIMRLSGFYNRHSRYKDIETLLKDTLAKLPKNGVAASAHEELVWNYERMSKRTEAVKQLAAFSEHCKDIPAAKKPSKTGEVAVDASAECLGKIAESSKKLATKWHGLWKKKNPTEELAASSQAAYKMYLENGAAAKDPELAQIRFQYAEILFQRKMFREASAQYALVQSANPEQKLSHDAAYAAVVALERSNDNKWNESDEKLFVTLSGVYLDKHPKGQFALELQFKRAFIAYEKGRYDEAAGGFKRIGWENTVNDANKERVLKSQDLYLDILNIKKDYIGLKDAASSLVKKGIAEPTRLQAVEKIYREAYFAEIQQMEEKGDLNGAVESYKKFALENKASELASKAWWNASQLQFKMGDAQGGAATCYQMHKLFPKSPMGKDCLTRAAQTFEASGMLEAAARVLLNLALVDEKVATKWREVSADFFALSGNRDRAKEMYTKLAEAEKSAAKQLPFYEKVAQLEKLDGNMQGYRKVQAKIMSFGIEPAASAAWLEQIEETFAKGNKTDAFNSARKILGRSLPKDLHARARYMQAQVLEEEFRSQSVKARMDRIAIVLALKTEKLEKAQRAYQETIKYGDPKVSVDAIRRLADCYLHYADAVRNMPMPEGLSEGDLQAFKGELDTLVIPMEEKGLDSLNQALVAAKKFELYDGSAASIQEQINKINMRKSVAGPTELKNPPVILPNISGILAMVGVRQ